MDKIEELKKIKILLSQGAISYEEFNLLKQRIIKSSESQTSDDFTNDGKLKSSSRGSSVIRRISYLALFVLILSGTFLVIANIESVSHTIGKYFNDNHSETNPNLVPKPVSTFRGEEIGDKRVVEFEFTRIRNQRGKVFNVPTNKIWTPLYFTYEDFGNNHYIGIPRMLTKQNTNSSIGRDYFHMNIYEDPSTGTWWERKSGYLVARERDFHSVNISIRNQDGLYGRNAIYVDGLHFDVKYTIYFIEENLR